MKVIFLDHQGVMYLKKHPNVGKLDPFDSECIKVLNSILIQTGAEIVVSSDWKYWVTLDEMKKFYLDQGIIKSPIDYTTKRPGQDYAKERSIEILEWLGNNSVDRWVSIDDLDMRNYLKNFIFVEDINQGIKGIDVKEKLLKYL